MHPHRSSALGYASAASAAHSRVYGACAAEAAASETSGLSVGGCIRAWRYFRPYPVEADHKRKYFRQNKYYRKAYYDEGVETPLSDRSGPYRQRI